MPPAGRYPILDAALDCVIVMDAAGLIVDFNPFAEKTFGHRREDVIGQPLDQVIIPAALRVAHRAGLAQLVQEQREDFSDYDLEWLCDHIVSAIRKLAEE